jgi:hypothetical protein
MKLEIARGLFLVSALSVASIAAAAWHESGPGVISLSERDFCPMPHQVRTSEAVKPDEDLLLFLFSLSQGTRSQG